MTIDRRPRDLGLVRLINGQFKRSSNAVRDLTTSTSHYLFLLSLIIMSTPIPDLASPALEMTASELCPPDRWL
jgi:hypothetical protein